MILVPFSPGSVTPSDIAGACRDRGHEPVFIVDPSQDEAVEHLRVLEAFGTVVTAGSSAATVSALGSGVPAGVVTFAEATVGAAAGLAAHYGLPGHDPAIVPRLTDKAVQRRRLNDCGMGRVFTLEVRGGQRIGDLADVPLPGVLKPAAGAGSRDTVFVTSVHDVANELARHPEGERFVVEERIPGRPGAIRADLADYVSVESAVLDGAVHHLGCTGRLPLAPPARERGLIFPVHPQESLRSALVATAADAVAALGIRHGVVHTELKLSPDGPRVIEVNARLGGGLGSIVPAAGGPDLVGLAVDLALGHLPTALPEARGVAVHLYVQPPLEATRLLTAPDAKVLRALPGVYALSRRARSGDDVDWRAGSPGRIVDVFIAADDLDELLARTEAVEEHVRRSSTWLTA